MMTHEVPQDGNRMIGIIGIIAGTLIAIGVPFVAIKYGKELADANSPALIIIVTIGVLGGVGLAGGAAWLTTRRPKASAPIRDEINTQPDAK